MVAHGGEAASYERGTPVMRDLVVEQDDVARFRPNSGLGWSHFQNERPQVVRKSLTCTRVLNLCERPVVVRKSLSCTKGPKLFPPPGYDASASHAAKMSKDEGNI